MALLAQRVAKAGFPVLRFDRRGVGDATGENLGFEHSAEDIAAASDTFRGQAHLQRVVALGNCDAATALALSAPKFNPDGFVLANPWTLEPNDDLPPPAAIRARYASKLRDPLEWRRLLAGGVDLGKLLRGFRRSRQTPPSELAGRLSGALASNTCPARILTARGDNTAIAFRAALPHVPVIERDTASHSFAGPGDADWLFAQVVSFLREVTPPLP